ncbi:MAG: Smr/MutS family protein [Alphaproteobacteria bacterium]
MMKSPPPPPPYMRDEDYDLWQKVIADIIPIHTIEKPTPPPPIASAEKTPLAKSAVIAPPPMVKIAVIKPPPPQPIDLLQADHQREFTKARKANKKSPEMVVDLHGMNMGAAHELLVARARACYEQQKKVMLVITGKGGRFGKPDGVLRAALPKWVAIQPLRGYIRGWQPAIHKDGGDGAFYLFVIRKKI